MIPTQETNFPRGGRKIQPVKPVKRKREDNLFASGHGKKAKKAPQEKTAATNLSGDWQLALKLQGTLTYKKIEEGMLVLCCVKHIFNLSLQVEFPGLTFATVSINQISDTFNKVLAEELKSDQGSFDLSLRKIIKVGQLMPAKILSVQKTEKGHEVLASVNPREVNSHKKHHSFLKGETVWVNVVSELDHGYELTLGVKNCRVFLPFKNTNGQKYEIGEPLYCTIYKVETSPTATTLTVGLKQGNVAHLPDLTLNNVIPGSRVEFTVRQASPHGFKGHILENCVGYLDETQTTKQKVKEDTTITAYVLFVEAVTKVTFLTMRDLTTLPGPEYAVGKIISAKVVSSAPGGLLLKVGDNGTGFVTNKRLLKTLGKDPGVDVQQAVKSKYPVGYQHSCRILDYNYMQQLYICTFEKQILKEKIFNVKDLEVGQLVKVVVDKILPNGITVKAGHVQGFVPNIHIVNSAYKESIKGKYYSGMSVDARVLKITEDNVIFTLKQGLLECKDVLSKEEDAKIGSQYSGFVVQTKIAGAAVVFFGDVKGWISSRSLNSGNVGRYADPREYFFLGQVVSVWITGYKKNRLQVSLNPPKIGKRKAIQVGENAVGKVTSVVADGVNVFLTQRKFEAFIPTAHICGSLDVSQIIQNIYERGDEIGNLMCVKNTGEVPVMSRRESIAHKKKNQKVYSFQKLRRNMEVRCSLEEETDTGIVVSAPIKDYTDTIFIPRDNFVKKKKTPTFVKQQAVICKVLNVDRETNKIDLSVVLDKKDATHVVETFCQLMEDVEYLTKVYLKKHRKHSDWRVGSHTTCKVQQIEANGDQFVTLLNGVKGHIPKDLAQPSKIGQEVECVVLDYNVTNNHLELCSKSRLKQKINETQDTLINKSFYSHCSANILLSTQFYMVGVLQDKKCNRQLVYLPAEKASQPRKIKITIVKRVGHRLIGVPKKLGLLLNKTEKAEEPKAEENLSEDGAAENADEEGADIEVDSDEEGEDIEADGDEEGDDVQAYSDEEGEDVEAESDGEEGENVESGGDEGKEESSDDDSDEEDEDTTAAVEATKTDAGNPHPKELAVESVLSGSQSFFISKDEDHIPSDSSSDEEEEEKVNPKKKIKLSARERAEAVRQEEERISKIEQQLADMPEVPQTAEQFDRQLLAKPNSSQLWLQYMSMHIAAAELDKARAVGKRAIETINMTLVDEKFNVWVALLNLENMYGTKESFDKIFEDAVRFNDSLEIYLSVVNMFAVSGKLAEMEEKIKKLRVKEKQSARMWLEIGKVYYTLQKFREARNVKVAALRSIEEKKKQFDIILKFGIMEFQLGDLEEAIANFETILNTFPAKVNIWTIYVDQLVKRKNIEAARKVLERAVSQKLAAKTMKILFQKYINFEKEHGTSETVDRVKELAKAFVTTVQ